MAEGCLKHHSSLSLLLSARMLCRLLPALLLMALLLLVMPRAAWATPVSESDISPSLLAAVKSVTGLSPDFPLQPNDPFFAQTTLDLNSKSISSLKGIQYFTELTRLTVEYNKLSSLRGIEFPDNIRYLSLAHNSITELSQISWPSRLRTLDLRNNRLTSPLNASFPENVSSISLDNNFLTAKASGMPKDSSVSYAGNFIYEASAIRPASLVIKDINAISLSPGDQQAIPFVNLTTSTNPNNQVPPRLITAQVEAGKDSPVQLQREDHRFMVIAQKAGRDNFVVSLSLSDYQITQYEKMSLTFYKASVPITVWQSAENRPGAAAANNGDAALQTALSGRSSNAVVDMTRFTDGKATFSPGLLAQLAGQNQKLILSHDFGNLTIEPKNLRTIANQANVSADATIQMTLNPYDARPVGYGPSRFSDKQIAILPYKDYNFSVQLRVPGSNLQDMELGSPVTAVLYLNNLGFTEWDLKRLTAFKDNGNSLDLLGGVYNSANSSFSYLLNGTGRFGLGTRGTPVQWVDLTINSMQIIHSDGESSTVNPAPLIYRGATMVPLRSVFEKMGASVNWHESIRSATISYGSKTIYITEGKTISGSDQAPYVINGRMLVPLRYITTEFGATVLWWGQEGKIRIVY